MAKITTGMRNVVAIVHSLPETLSSGEKPMQRILTYGSETDLRSMGPNRAFRNASAALARVMARH